MNSIRFEADMSSLCICLIMRLLCICKSTAFFSFSTILFQWNDAKHQLTIGKRNGMFPGMLVNRTFNVTIVRANIAIGVDITLKPDKIINYKGEGITIQLY